ncbi:hypothetical protein [Massilia sp. Root335]|jgi:hypothetical protein|uniref:hypothetical protein n=1 Tax=Massilia sp. Root335 TaxID=1736517 RepID=UPI0006FBDF16|nr:hypothetical protein [Massilia sp. Root335]KQV48994.1 hypothetical protein ASC93_13050 [Massilia sp. Root335]
MKLEVALAELKGVRVALAFPPPAWVAPGVGDVLLERLRPHFPTLPVMLVSVQRHGVRAHAAFQAQALVDGADLAHLPRTLIDLDVPPAPADAPPPF